MTKDHRNHLEARLLQERERVTNLLSRYAERHEGEDEQDEAGDLTKMPLHMADQGTDTMQQELDAVMADRETATLAEIDAALERLYHDPDHFGMCERTGKEIPFARLDIVPWARTC
ncbi:MAG: TraR/DksA family transcriptional regulator [Gemmatimonadales bacterium]|jgi:RNA polymerase-binding transcription factor DksA